MIQANPEGPRFSFNARAPSRTSLPPGNGGLAEPLHLSPGTRVGCLQGDGFRWVNEAHWVREAPPPKFQRVGAGMLPKLPWCLDLSPSPGRSQASFRTRAEWAFSAARAKFRSQGRGTSVRAASSAGTGGMAWGRRTLNQERVQFCGLTQENIRFRTYTALYFKRGDRSIGGRRSPGLK